jgi:hypothetical protein
MKSSRLAVAGLSVLSLLFVAATAMAQGTPMRIRGTVTAIDATSVTIATREGPSVTAKLGDKWGAAVVSPVAMSDIKPGSFVGVASLGSNALEVLVFPEAMRGTGEGSYPWDLQPESTMTNASVATVAAGGDGQTLKLDYKGGTKTITVKPGTPVVTVTPGQPSDVKVGAKVFAGAVKAADGSLTVMRMNVGKDGMTPPM